MFGESFVIGLHWIVAYLRGMNIVWNDMQAFRIYIMLVEAFVQTEFVVYYNFLFQKRLLKCLSEYSWWFQS